jgi:hypothetical protein
MVLLVGAPTQAAILNLLGLLATQQVLSGGARVFTVGTAAYQAAWFFEALGRRGDYARLEREILDWDLDGLALQDEPLGPPNSTSPCGTTYCRRTEFMSHQLRRWSGSDEAMRNLYRTLYSRFLLKSTVPGAFQQIPGLIRQAGPVARSAARGGTSTRRSRPCRGRSARAAGRVVDVRPRALPRRLWVVADDTAVARASAHARNAHRRLRTPPPRHARPAEPDDWNMLNNQRGFGVRPGWLLLVPNRPRDTYFDAYFSRHTARDRLTMGWAPTAWYNDAGGWTFGTRIREDYLGRFELNEAWVSLSSGWGTEGSRTDPNGRLRIRNPVGLRARGWSQELGLAWEEGRAAVELGMARRFRTGVTDRTVRSLGAALQWVTVTDPVYLDRGYYDDGTLELTVTTAGPNGAGPSDRAARQRLRLSRREHGGSARPTATLDGSARPPGRPAARIFAGATASAARCPAARDLSRAPIRSPVASVPSLRGSILAGSDFRYHPGGAGVRGLDPAGGW